MLINERYVKRSELPTAFVQGYELYVSQEWLIERYPRTLLFNGLSILGEKLTEDWGAESDVAGYRFTNASCVPPLREACRLLKYNHPGIFHITEQPPSESLIIGIPEFD